MATFCTAEQWTRWDPNPLTRAVVSAAGDDAASLLGPRLQFGTAGLRGPMGAGSARMNDLTVLWATQGLAAHLARTLGEVRWMSSALDFLSSPPPLPPATAAAAAAS